MADDARFMGRAIELAERGRGLTAPNPCVGAVLVRDGEVVAEGWHTAWGKAHAEVEALRDAAAKGVDPRACTLYVTLEPCIMCAGAILQARISRVVYGADDPKNGGVVSLYRLFEDRRLNHTVAVTRGIQKEICAEILSGFFREKRISSAALSE